MSMNREFLLAVLSLCVGGCFDPQVTVNVESTSGPGEASDDPYTTGDDAMQDSSGAIDSDALDSEDGTSGATATSDTGLDDSPSTTGLPECEMASWDVSSWDAACWQ